MHSFSSHELNKMREDYYVRPEDFDVEGLWAAACEGRLILLPRKVDRTQIRKDVLLYVDRIRPLVSHKFRPYIDELWEQILACDEFMDYLTHSKARKFRQFNKYNLMRIIGVLREAGVYEAYSDRKYNALLEYSYDSPYRKYLSLGFEERFLLKHIIQIVISFSDKHNLTFG